MRIHHAAYRSMRLILFTFLITSVSLWLTTDRPAHAQTGSGSITFVKEATPGSDINFLINHDPQPLGTWGTLGSTAGQLDGPDGVAIGLENSIYVADKIITVSSNLMPRVTLCACGAAAWTRAARTRRFAPPPAKQAAKAAVTVSSAHPARSTWRLMARFM